MSAMETTFTVRTDTDNDAMQVPDGIETVVVNDDAEQVIVPPGVQIIRLQVSSNRGGHSQPSSSSLRDLLDDYTRADHSVSTDTTRVKRSTATGTARAPAMAEKSLSLPSCPPTPPGSRSAGTDAPDFRAAVRRPPTAETISEPVSPVTAPATSPVTATTASPVTSPPTSPVSAPPASPPMAPSAPAEEAPPTDIFNDSTLKVDRERVINQQPASASVPNGRLVRYAGETEQEMRDPLVGHGSTKMRKLDSFGWREEFERGEKESKPTIQKFGRAVADIMCCWLGV
ncbi:hypothetical protein FJT64_021613 [Amphibalanus amphitrite]|uniref:Uncharacterized protein n=1 Tax=Amphibalanus amphitrite TaxID=1232801 RepID=A0A6A4WJK1_AMPAM|nr:hypothetical protein FJT64_021613 [Amphibalanus amphitrite]